MLCIYYLIIICCIYNHYSPKHHFSDYMKGVEDIQAAEPKLILKRSPKEVSKLEQVHWTIIHSIAHKVGSLVVCLHKISIVKLKFLWGILVESVGVEYCCFGMKYLILCYWWSIYFSSSRHNITVGRIVIVWFSEDDPVPYYSIDACLCLQVY